MNVIRVFPRRTKLTPTDSYAFVGDPPLWLPEADRVHVSCTFTWDKPEALRLVGAWSQHYMHVWLGGPQYGMGSDFTPGMYVREGITFTSRGCNNQCPFCLVPEMEGKLRTIPITLGHTINDNNLLQTGREHMSKVFQMLKSQRKAATFGGGLQASLVDDWVAEELRGLRIDQLFLAADTIGALKPLKKAVGKLSFLPRRKLRCYVLIGFQGETIEQAKDRLEQIWEIGCMPFAQLYQPPDKFIEYSEAWKWLNREWCRPAAMVAMHQKVGYSCRLE